MTEEAPRLDKQAKAIDLRNKLCDLRDKILAENPNRLAPRALSLDASALFFNTEEHTVGLEDFNFQKLDDLYQIAGLELRDELVKKVARERPRKDLTPTRAWGVKGLEDVALVLYSGEKSNRLYWQRFEK
jgi:hypothetical protein